MIRLIHTADFHLSSTSSIDCNVVDDRFDKPVNIRLIDKLDRINFIFNYAIKNKINFVIIAGDVYDNNSPTQNIKELFAKLVSKVLAAKIHVIIISGNHDNVVFNDISHLSIDNKYLHVIVKPKTIVIDNTYFHCLPYLRDYKLVNNLLIKKFIQGRNLKGEDNIFIGHFPIQGAIIGSTQKISMESVIYESSMRGFDYVALGDIHIMQKIGGSKRISKGNEIWYSGSIVRNNFGELDEKSFNLVELNNKKVHVRNIPLIDRKFYNLTYEFDFIVDLFKKLNNNKPISIDIDEGAIVKINYSVNKSIYKSFDENSFCKLFKEKFKCIYLKLNIISDINVKLDGINDISLVSAFEYVLNNNKPVNKKDLKKSLEIGRTILNDL
jgi:DNA repair exonuclease SbcCD nuclease subunit